MGDVDEDACQCCGQICGRDVCLECEAVIHRAELDLVSSIALGHKGCADEVGGSVLDWPEKHHQDMKDDWDD